jgi:hypothetical protein
MNTLYFVRSSQMEAEYMKEVKKKKKRITKRSDIFLLISNTLLTNLF